MALGKHASFWAIALITALCHLNVAMAACPAKWTSHDRSCYLVLPLQLNWFEAQVACNVLGGHLATISSYDENRAVLNAMASVNEYHAWIGLQSLEGIGQYKWINTRAKPAYTNWSGGRPDNFKGREFCTIIRRDFNDWNDIDCHMLEAPVCEIEQRWNWTLDNKLPIINTIHRKNN